MKLIILFNFYILATFLCSQEFNFKSMGTLIRNEVTMFPDGGKFISFRHEGGFETDIGKYGKYQCHGSILYNNESTLENMYFACNNIDQNGDSYISMGKRKRGSEIDRAVGQTEILDGTGFWKDFVNTTCTYAIEYIDNVVFAPGKCKKP